MRILRQSVIVMYVSIAFMPKGGNAIAQHLPRDVAEAPADPGSNGRIAAAEEPGTPFILAGTVVGEDGKTPLPGVMVYAYHTDAAGFYRKAGVAREEGETNPRLRGWAKTDAAGHFAFATVRPAGYPGGKSPAHVHLHAWGGGYPRQWFMLEFEGDPLLAGQRFTDKTAHYLTIAPVTRDAKGGERCSFLLRMRKDSNFPREE